MNYNLFKIEPEVDLKIIGDSRQIEGVESPYVIRGPKSFLHLNKPISDINEIELPKFKLSKDAFLTDYMDLSYSGKFKLISNKLKKLIESHSIDNIDFYSVEVLDANQKCHKYYLITSKLKVIDRVVNWGDSSFVWWDMYSNEIKQKIDDIKEYSDWFLYWTERIPRPFRNWRIRFSSIVLNEYDYDFVKLTSPLLGFFVSSKLKDRLIEEKLTGFTFSSLEKFEVKEQRMS